MLVRFSGSRLTKITLEGIVSMIVGGSGGDRGGLLGEVISCGAFGVVVYGAFNYYVYLYYF